MSNEHEPDGGGIAGMTLREWYAGQALVGFQSFVKGGWFGVMPDEMVANVAENCFRIADAMVEAINGR